MPHPGQGIEAPSLPRFKRSWGGWCNQAAAPLAGRVPPIREDPVDRAGKKELVTALNTAFKATNVVVVAHYSGLTVAQMQNLRRQMKHAGAAVKVAKNRLAKIGRASCRERV